jgi:hypothetical protein
MSYIDGGPGNDLVSGGTGDDALQGGYGGGRDKLWGNKGHDGLTDGWVYHDYAGPDPSGGDELFGGPGDDALDTTAGVSATASSRRFEVPRSVF